VRTNTLLIIYYDYLGTSNTGGLAYYEYGGSLGYAFGGDLEPAIGISVMHSPEFYAETGDATAVEASLGSSLRGSVGDIFNVTDNDTGEFYLSIGASI